MNLRDKATKIIRQQARTDDDIVELSQIAYEMSIIYLNARVKAWEMEAEYNLHRIEKTREARKEGLAVWEAGDVGKFYAETQHWGYRVAKEECVGMKEILNQIDNFRISYYRKEKSIDQALTNKQ